MYKPDRSDYIDLLSKLDTIQVQLEEMLGIYNDVTDSLIVSRGIPVVEKPPLEGYDDEQLQDVLNQLPEMKKEALFWIGEISDALDNLDKCRDRVQEEIGRLSDKARRALEAGYLLDTWSE